ncbi:hypothetical protein DENSPDRAFT_244712 [Dentipellis sp. KUC8613]|nr:hypothetical protein DENSPDRAFT_244712 [Dentipellis sp. KUC8613]
MSAAPSDARGSKPPSKQPRQPSEAHSSRSSTTMDEVAAKNHVALARAKARYEAVRKEALAGGGALARPGEKDGVKAKVDRMKAQERVDNSEAAKGAERKDEAESGVEGQEGDDEEGDEEGSQEDGDEDEDYEGEDGEDKPAEGSEHSDELDDEDEDGDEQGGEGEANDGQDSNIGEGQGIDNENQVQEETAGGGQMGNSVSDGKDDDVPVDSPQDESPGNGPQNDVQEPAQGAAAPQVTAPAPAPVNAASAAIATSRLDKSLRLYPHPKQAAAPVAASKSNGVVTDQSHANAAQEDTSTNDSQDSTAKTPAPSISSSQKKMSPPRLSPPAVQLKQSGPAIDIDSLSDSDTDLPDLNALLHGTQPQVSRSQPTPRAPSASQPPLSQRPKPTPAKRPSQVASSQPSSTFKDLSATPRASIPKNKRKFEYEVIAGRMPAPDQRNGKKAAAVKQEVRSPERLMPPPKRPRMSSQATRLSQPQEQGLKTRAKRHPVFWHLDGSVVIQIQDTIFKLHRSRLAKQSTYFANLFARSERGITGDADQEMADEENGREGTSGFGQGDAACPTYTVDVTTPLDFERLLVALDEGMSYIINPPPFDTLASILRASTALDFGALRSWAARTLEQMWPRELEALTSDAIPRAAITIQLARKCGVPKALKRAYYELLRTSAFGQAEFDDDNEDEDDDDDDEIQIVNEDGSVPKSSKDSSRTPASQLPHAELMRLIETRQHMLADWIAIAAAPESFNCPTTSTQAPADEAKRCIAADTVANDSKWSTLVLRGQIFENFLYDPILGMDALIEIDWKKEGYCEACVDARTGAWERRQKKLWENLDVWLGLHGGK